MSGTDSRVFYDNSNTLFNFTTPGWNIEEGSQWADGSRTVYREEGVDGGDLGEFTFRFNGTSVSFLGSVPLSLTSDALRVQVDQGEAFDVSLRPASRLQQGTYREIFEISQVEGGGEHVVHVTEVPPGLAIDFAAVNDDALDDKDLIVDDFASMFDYWGAWQTMINRVDALGLPYGFTTHGSSTEGSSISVFGLFNLTSDMVVRFQLDDTVEDIRFSPSTSSQGSLNFPWYSRQNIGNGGHFFSANLLEPNGQTFYLDYIRYTADTPEERVAAAEAAKSRFPLATLLGILAGIVSIFLATMVVVCLFRQSRKRAKAAGNLLEIRQRTDRYLDLDMELGPVKGEPALGRAGPNAFVVLPPTEPTSTSPQNLEAQPFIIPASRWANLPAVPPSRDEKAALKAEPLYHEVQQPSTPQHSPDASHQIDELQRVVQILAAETENLRGRLRETSQAQDDTEPPPYEDPRLPSRPSSRLLTPPSSMTIPQPPGLPAPPPPRKGRRRG